MSARSAIHAAYTPRRTTTTSDHVGLTAAASYGYDGRMLMQEPIAPTRSGMYGTPYHHYYPAEQCVGRSQMPLYGGSAADYSNHTYPTAAYYDDPNRVSRTALSMYPFYSTTSAKPSEWPATEAAWANAGMWGAAAGVTTLGVHGLRAVVWPGPEASR